MADIPTIEPFQFIRSTAFSERVQLANKLNEVIDALNQIETIDDLQTQIDAINSEISEIQTAIEDTNSDVSTLSDQVNTIVSEVNGLLKEVVNEVVLDAPEYGQVRVKVVHEDETETASNALQIPVIVDGGISLISGTTARSFKIRYITADGVTHTTNDFVIPEGGGGTDVTVTSVTILEGDTDNSFKFEIGLSDGSEIQSNSYPFPAASELTPATTSQLGGIKVGTHLSVTADGTLSVDMTEINTAAVASTVMFTADSSKVTLHADSLAGSEFTEDIPQASQGGAGTIDQASYAKIAATEAKVNALAPSVTVNDDVSPAQITVAINGKSSTANLPAGGGSGGATITEFNGPSETQAFWNALTTSKVGDRVIWTQVWDEGDPATVAFYVNGTISKVSSSSVEIYCSGIYDNNCPYGYEKPTKGNPIVRINMNGYETAQNCIHMVIDYASDNIFTTAPDKPMRLKFKGWIVSV